MLRTVKWTMLNTRHVNTVKWIMMREREREMCVDKPGRTTSV